MKRVLYESRSLVSPGAETEIYQEGDKVIFSHNSGLAEDGHSSGFCQMIGVDVFKK